MNVLIADSLSPEARDGLEALGLNVSEQPELTVDSLPSAVAGHEILIVSSTQVTRRSIEAGTDLLLIVEAGSGNDSIDVDAASDAAVFVADCPHVTASAYAEHALGLLIDLDRSLQSDDAGPGPAGLYGRSLGLYGFGEDARRLADGAAALGMSVRVHTDALTEALAAEAGVTVYDEAEALFRRCDFVSVHVTPDSSLAAVSSDQLAVMRPGSVLIAAGGVDSLDLAAVLNAASKSGLRVGLDAPSTGLSEEQDLLVGKLGRRKNCRVTRDQAGATRSAWREAATEAVRVVHGFLQTGTVDGCLNVSDSLPAAATLIVRHRHETGALIAVFDVLREEDIQVLDVDNLVFAGGKAACMRIRMGEIPSPAALDRMRRHQTVRRVDLVAEDG